ncbi:hypothetical protein J4210_02390 [Candidatus Woesearchaeota archaeon]|nr:hypothetical protein [Candidatus Woesearchaeota archaeon]
MKTKKGASEMWWIIMAAILAIVIVIIVIIWFKGSGGRAFEDVDKKIGGLADCDKDGVADLFDKCKCDPAIGEDFPSGVTACPTDKKCADPPVCV